MQKLRKISYSEESSRRIVLYNWSKEAVSCLYSVVTSNFWDLSIPRPSLWANAVFNDLHDSIPDSGNRCYIIVVFCSLITALFFWTLNPRKFAVLLFTQASNALLKCFPAKSKGDWLSTDTKMLSTYTTITTNAFLEFLTYSVGSPFDCTKQRAFRSLCIVQSILLKTALDQKALFSTRKPNFPVLLNQNHRAVCHILSLWAVRLQMRSPHEVSVFCDSDSLIVIARAVP